MKPGFENNVFSKQSATSANNSKNSDSVGNPDTSPNQVLAQQKSHRVEGKNKKSLHQKQNQTSSNQPQSPVKQKCNNAGQTRVQNKNENPPTVNDIPCSTLEEFSKRAKELKDGIYSALDKQTVNQITDQPIEVVKLKEDILKLSGMTQDDKDVYSLSDNGENKYTVSPECLNNVVGESEAKESRPSMESNQTTFDTGQLMEQIKSGQCVINSQAVESSDTILQDKRLVINDKIDDKSVLTQTRDKFNADVNNTNKTDIDQLVNQQSKKTGKSSASSSGCGVAADDKNDCFSESFEPLDAKLDSDSKYIALTSSLQKHFKDAPHLLDPLCRKLVLMSEQNSQLSMKCDECRSENNRLSKVKQKLENLCRELQKSNNAIRIESLDLIKVEQGKAKEQTTKIQSTLSGVIKLFDENQQRNMTLRQENQDLQTKLKSLLDHCDNWEKSVETTLRQRDIENRLLKTELAKANLLKNEEKEKFLGEKQDLLQILSMMQEQQHRIEGQEAKLRSDLSSYASKYDKCQQVISNGMTRFQVESKKMLKQIEKSKQDYKMLLSKYELNSKRMTQLLEEKQQWDRTMNLANKKIVTLEKLCRALKERKDPQSHESTTQSKTEKNKSKANKSTKAPSIGKEENETVFKLDDGQQANMPDVPVPSEVTDRPEINNTPIKVRNENEPSLNVSLENVPLTLETNIAEGNLVNELSAVSETSAHQIDA